MKKMQNTYHFPWKNIRDWYMISGNHGYPWRDYTYEGNTLLYRVWIAEIFLQQTQADRVVGYFNKVHEVFPTIQSLAETDYDTFFPFYQGLGYYSRARNILKTAKIVVEQYSMTFPTVASDLKKLPGIGAYTSEAIRGFGYGIPTLAWDTNLEKIFSRYFFGSKMLPLSDEEKRAVLEDFLEWIKQETDGEIESMKKLTRDINNGLMDFARLIDKGNYTQINTESYPLQSSEWFKTKGENEIQIKQTSQYFPTPDAWVEVTLHQDHKIYYSSTEEKYTPFILPPAESRDIRKYVQTYFRDNHGLEVSVRPVHKKWLDTDGKATVAVRAQIQTGTHHFRSYKKHQIEINSAVVD